MGQRLRRRMELAVRDAVRNVMMIADFARYEDPLDSMDEKRRAPLQ